MDKLKLLPMLAEVGSFFPKVISAKDAPCKQVIHRGEDVRIDLLKLPVLTTWPQDGGRFITLPCVITRDPKSGKRNVGMYRMQVYDGQTTGMHWQRQKVAAEHMRDRLREASTRLRRPRRPHGPHRRRHHRRNLAPHHQHHHPHQDPRRPHGGRRSHRHRPRHHLLRHRPRPARGRGVPHRRLPPQKPLELVKGETVDLEVPAHAEYILEGYVELGELRTEGPFGDHTGFYTMQDDYPVFHLTCITHRKDPIYAATIVGKPPMEDAWMGKAVERIFLPLMQLTLPEIVDVNLPPRASSTTS